MTFLTLASAKILFYFVRNGNDDTESRENFNYNRGSGASFITDLLFRFMSYDIFMSYFVFRYCNAF